MGCFQVEVGFGCLVSFILAGCLVSCDYLFGRSWWLHTLWEITVLFVNGSWILGPRRTADFVAGGVQAARGGTVKFMEL